MARCWPVMGTMLACGWYDVGMMYDVVVKLSDGMWAFVVVVDTWCGAGVAEVTTMHAGPSVSHALRVGLCVAAVQRQRLRKE